MAVIELDHVTKTYKSRGRRTVANDDVSLRVDEGEVFGLFGHNGAGKTTIVNQLLGLLKPDSGSIVIDGKDITKNRNLGRYLCSVQPQSKTPLGELTPRSVTRVMGQLRGISAAEVDRRTTELFEKLDIMQWADVEGTKLSGGVLRLTGFCMAAVAPGRAVILDEPTNDVDPVRRRFLWSAIRDLTNDGTAVVVVTHSIREAESAVDTMAILDEGKVLTQGNVRRIKGETAGNRMKLEAVALVPKDRFVRPAWSESLKVSAAELTLTFERELAAEALKWAAEQRDGGLLAEYSLTEITLEDMYIELVGNKGAVAGVHR
ncbi:ATP-binding cassette domain-containing protein [Verrucosispora sp. SN26_14.1]|uniref:ABC transporter ATP-binding protein n=1 Tax=Verrucosispora sp. SN26_14.1 TaxID=2527879 RepID=UPI0010349204|nr:ATP-binding cassette domain-containing protein [Verrucosispora sp. SN26_14.1]TBL42271.1 ATP-binding cassette domain-containing protein [Verrucosispora sp. SN26_14.1]